MTFRTVLIGSISCALLSMGAPASAQRVDDVRCLLVSNVFSKSAKDPRAKRLSEAATYFYLGRLDGRISDSQLKRSMLGLQKTLKTANAGALMAECAREMQARANFVQNLSRQLKPQK